MQWHDVPEAVSNMPQLAIFMLLPAPHNAISKNASAQHHKQAVHDAPLSVVK